MPTVVKFMGDDNQDRRVTEEARKVGAKVNGAVERNLPFVVLTDAETNKEFSVGPHDIASFEEA